MGLDTVIEELYREAASAIAGLDHDLDHDLFVAALRRSLEKAAPAENAAPAFLRGLRLRDLALATACAAGSTAAWDIFVAEMRGPLRSAGRAMAGERGEEIADALFGELYTARKSKLASFHGRSSLLGWMRAVLYQSYVDRLRAEKRLTPLDPEREDAGPAHDPAAPAVPDPVEQSEYSRIARGALERALRALPPRQKLLLDYYYFHGLTLREAAALVKVHEATASRELDRARTALKKHLTAILSSEYRLGEQEMRECLYSAAQSGMVWTQEK